MVQPNSWRADPSVVSDPECRYVRAMFRRGGITSGRGGSSQGESGACAFYRVFRTQWVISHLLFFQAARIISFTQTFHFKHNYFGSEYTDCSLQAKNLLETACKISFLCCSLAFFKFNFRRIILFYTFDFSRREKTNSKFMKKIFTNKGWFWVGPEHPVQGLVACTAYASHPLRVSSSVCSPVIYVHECVGGPRLPTPRPNWVIEWPHGAWTPPARYRLCTLFREFCVQKDSPFVWDTGGSRVWIASVVAW